MLAKKIAQDFLNVRFTNDYNFLIFIVVFSSNVFVKKQFT